MTDQGNLKINKREREKTYTCSKSEKKKTNLNKIHYNKKIREVP